MTAIAVIETAAGNREPYIKRVSRSLVSYTFRHAWLSLLKHYDEVYPEFPDLPTSEHVNVNSESVLSLIEDLKPELVIVSGTNLLKRSLIAKINKFGRIINLHTGISPYIKGGPNCTNWALATGRFDLIGNTVMWLDAGIDSGNIIATERTLLTGKESLRELHLKVMDHAHDLYSRVALRIVQGRQVPSISQNTIPNGRLFLSRDWSASVALKAMLNFYIGYNRRSVSRRSREVLIDLCNCTDQKGD